MIIVLGFDNTGKTTLVEELSNHLNLEVIPSRGQAKKEEQVQWIEEQIERNKVVIHERFTLFEEIIYGNFVRSTPKFTIDNVLVEKLLRKKNPIIIYTRPSKEAVMRFGDRPQMKGVIEQASQLLNAFDELSLRLISDGWEVLPYNYEDPNGYDKLLESLKVELFYREYYKGWGEK